MDHCVAAFVKSQKEKLYQIYVTDSLKIIAENTAAYAGGKSPSVRWIDAINDYENPNPEPEKTAEEVIDHIKDRLAHL